MESEQAKKSIEALTKLRFRFQRSTGEGENYSAYMMRKKGASTLYAEIDSKGNVNGKTLESFISWVKSF